MIVVCVKDMKAGLCFPPQTVRTTVEATRAFQAQVRNPESLFAAYPHEFRLFEIGTFDEATGVITRKEHFSDLGSAHDFLPQPSENTLPFPGERRSN